VGRQYVADVVIRREDGETENATEGGALRWVVSVDELTETVQAKETARHEGEKKEVIVGEQGVGS
jgi:hypothetical protein